MFNSWRTPVIVISVFVVLSVIAGILIAVFYHKNKEFSLEHDQLLRTILPKALTYLRTYKVNVILDADTAHPHLIMSRGGKQVRYKNTQTKGVDGGKDRFDQYLGVVGKDGFSSGCFYFEVQVKGQTVWDLGVTRESVNRKDWISLRPEKGYWIVGQRHREYRARNSPDYSFSLNANLQRVGVFVDYEKGLVSFNDVESKSHIYSYTDQCFNEKLYPFVCLGFNRNTNSTPLIICDDY
ncbi:erythroid membrane-associated protein isoform X2 [Labeo rohita]|uniref:erythroid membrane-associated protein isoform X2 n=1 Tax=Labeo rohita TaxID=84645 RepID=UPI0021E30597|nr:erythroid membrane-associated protein isoform X2 [Labeo rohita]